MTSKLTGHSAAYSRMLDFINGIECLPADMRNQDIRDELTRLYELVSDLEAEIDEANKAQGDAEEALEDEKYKQEEAAKERDQAVAERDALDAKLNEFKDKFERSEERAEKLEERLRELDVESPPLALVHKKEPTDAEVASGRASTLLIDLAALKVQQVTALGYPKVDSVAALRRLPVGIKLRLVMLNGGEMNAVRTIDKVTRHTILFRSDNNLMSRLRLPAGTEVTPLINGFCVRCPNGSRADYQFEGKT